MTEITLFWFRRDMRLNDNCALCHALKGSNPVLPVFFFDPFILQKLASKNDKRVIFIYQTLINIKQTLEQMNSSMFVLYKDPLEAFKEILKKYNVKALYYNNDYEPYAIERDTKVNDLMISNGVEVLSFKDQVIFDKDDIAKNDGKPYTVFTPYMRKWKDAYQANHQLYYPSEEHFENFHKIDPLVFPKIEKMAFINDHYDFPPVKPETNIIKNYHNTRDLPYLDGTSRVGIHLRFGTLSIREAMNIARKYNETWMNELIWREFYMMILWHFPYVTDHPFKKKYEHIQWINDEAHFQRWCEGNTGYPMVDAGMRQLNQTGYMHNRLRMITASFLTKHLLIDWRWGEIYFAEKLLDYELASNNGGWQWSASTGCDAVPYFRIFNPESQQQKYDPEGLYIKRWLPEYQTGQYPERIVDHKYARERALSVYKNVPNL